MAEFNGGGSGDEDDEDDEDDEESDDSSITARNVVGDGVGIVERELREDSYVSCKQSTAYMIVNVIVLCLVIHW